MKLAVQHTLLPGATLSEKFQRAAEYGFAGVELTAWGFTGAMQEHGEEIQRAAQSSGIPVSSLCSGGADDLVHPEAQVRQQRLSGLVNKLRFAADIGAGGVIALPIRPPVRLPDLSPVAAAHQLITELTVAAVKAALAETQTLPAQVFLEPLNRYEAYYLRRLGQAAELCAAIGNPRAAIMADLFHMSIEEASLAGALAAVIDRVGHLHLADSNRLEPGQGHTDFVAPFRVLRQHGFSGWLALECGLSSAAATALPATVQYIRDCWDRAAD